MYYTITPKNVGDYSQDTLFTCIYFLFSMTERGRHHRLYSCFWDPCIRRLTFFLHLSLLMFPVLAKKADENTPHSRQKRILWITSDGRLALPPGTTLVITPSLSMPFVRYPPDGFFSNLTVSLPFTSKYTHHILIFTSNTFLSRTFHGRNSVYLSNLCGCG